MCCASSVIRTLPSPGSTDPEDLAVLAGLTVVDTDDDDPVLLWPDGTPVDTWREDYPYDERMTREYYEHAKRLLQIELVKLQNWVKNPAIAGKPDRKIIDKPAMLSERGSAQSFMRL
jgi:hypothetical protein